MILGFLSILLTENGFGQNNKILTLSQAIEIAQKVNPTLLQAANQIRLKKINLNQKKANFLPDINITGQSTQQYNKTPDLDTSNYINNNNQSLNLRISSNLTLFNGFYDISSLQQSKFKLEAEKEYFNRSRQSIVFETIQQYIQVVLSKELIQVDKTNLEAQRLQLTRIEEFFKAGRRPVADLYQQKAEISRYEYQLLNSERNFQVNKLQLLKIMGFKPDPEYQVINPGIENLINQIIEFNRNDILTRALKERPEVKAQKNQIKAAKKEITAAHSGFWPKLTLFAEVGSNYSSAIESYNFSDQFFENNLNASFRLSLSIPVFDKSMTRNNVATAKVNLRNQQLEMDKLVHQINVEVKQAIEDYFTARKQVNVAESQEEYSLAALKSVEERYNVNAATMAELIQVRSQYYQSQYDLVEAKFNLLIRGIAVAFYQGDGEGMISILNPNSNK
jgi:outer membrane protein